MPRPRVDERTRKRINKACLYCQKTKQKCDGLMPCGKCARRNQSNSCAYSPHERSYGHRRRRQKPAERGHLDIRHTESIEANASAATSRHSESNQLSGTRPSVKEPEVTVPGLSQVLYDNKGQIVYLGNCAALAFLQNIQQLIETETGHTADVSNLSVVEELPPVQEGGLDLYTTRNKAELKGLVDVFFISTCGILDLFDRARVEALLDCWTSTPESLDSGSSAVLYLVMACAAQIRSASLIDKLRAQSFYQQGRQLALLELTNNPTNETIQAFTLISIYMLGCSWRNGASLNLGIAISAAKSLGYHQDTTNSVYDMKERHRRAQVWKTLHYHDLFFSAMMGRSSSTSNTDSTPVDDGDPNRDNVDDEFNQSLSMTESLRAFLIIERAVNKVYTKETVSLGILQSLTRELQENSINLSKTFCTPAAATQSSQGNAQQLNLRNAHVACSYYFAMMLLTRPFLITSLRAKSSMEHMESEQSNGFNSNGAGGSISSEIFSGAMTCIDSATYTVQLLHELLTAKMLFNNMPFIVAWTFVSVLVLNSAYFGQLGSQRAVSKALRQAEDIFESFTVNSPQARRYQHILKRLSRAAEDHWSRVEQRTSQVRSAYIPRLFQLHPNSLANGSNDEGCSGNTPREDTDPVVSSMEVRTGGTWDASPCLAAPESSLQRPRQSVGQPVLLGNDVLNRVHNSQGFASFPGNIMEGTRSPLIPDEAVGYGSWLQLDDYSSIWDFSWAGAL